MYTLQSFNLIKQIPLILKSRFFFACICSFLMIFDDKRDDFDFEIVNFPFFKMMMFLAL